ncbi:unnamed protein product [Brassica oleracea var. botrytis]
MVTARWRRLKKLKYGGLGWWSRRQQGVWRRLKKNVV